MSSISDFKPGDYVLCINGIEVHSVIKLLPSREGVVSGCAYYIEGVSPLGSIVISNSNFYWNPNRFINLGPNLSLVERLIYNVVDKPE